MKRTNLSAISLLHSARWWWKEKARRDGRIAATRALFALLAEFARDSTPARRRARFGDADFDWEHRVNTTSGAVYWRDRLLGAFHSPYQPTEAALFHEMMMALSAQPGFDFPGFTFIDLGSGKGRTLLMASDYAFRRIVGVELLPALHGVARENLSKYSNQAQKCFTLESICMDATEFAFPFEPIVLFLFNPLPEFGLRKVVENLRASLREHPRKIYVVYHNPELGVVLNECDAMERIGGTHQYAIYGSR